MGMNEDIFYEDMVEQIRDPVANPVSLHEFFLTLAICICIIAALAIACRLLLRMFPEKGEWRVRVNEAVIKRFEKYALLGVLITLFFVIIYSICSCGILQVGDRYTFYGKYFNSEMSANSLNSNFTEPSTYNYDGFGLAEFPVVPDGYTYDDVLSRFVHITGGSGTTPRATAAPRTTLPTTMPLTTAPHTTVPFTTIFGTTVLGTTAAGTTAPGTTAPSTVVTEPTESTLVSTAPSTAPTTGTTSPTHPSSTSVTEPTEHTTSSTAPSSTGVTEPTESTTASTAPSSTGVTEPSESTVPSSVDPSTTTDASSSLVPSSGEMTSGEMTSGATSHPSTAGATDGSLAPSTAPNTENILPGTALPDATSATGTVAADTTRGALVTGAKVDPATGPKVDPNPVKTGQSASLLIVLVVLLFSAYVLVYIRLFFPQFVVKKESVSKDDAAYHPAHGEKHAEHHKKHARYQKKH